MRILIWGFLLGTQLLWANENLWTKPFQAYGQGPDTRRASLNAYENAKPQVSDFQLECREDRGEISVKVEYGYCSVSHDPLFCLNGCYTCPVYGNATCYLETNGAFKPGVEVEISVDSGLFTGTTQVGQVLKGERYTIVQIKGAWVALAKADGTQLPGWIQLARVKIPKAPA